ncbi:MAG TPA: PAS domain S-box protein, partial [Anaerolineae bacterium]|nr:PAS domain S-box protein [Anaerolineae bacterium]
KRLTYMGVNVIQPVLDRQKRGEITEAQALAEGRDLIRRMRYMYGLGANYLFMGNRFGQVLAQPSDPQMEGSNQLDLTDAEGRFITREFIQVAASPAGEGYVEYHDPPPDSDQPQLKIAYVVGIPAWEAYIGTAMHLRDLDAESQVFARNSLLLTGGLFIVVFLAVFFVLRPVFSSYHTLLGVFDQIRRNPDGVPGVPAERYPPGSEGRQLLSGFRDMLRQVQFSRQQVKDSEERFSLAVQGTDDGIWDWQVKTNTVYYSPRWKEMIGYADNELPNRFEEWSTRIHPDDLAETMKTLNAHLAGQTPFFEKEIRIRHKDGSYRWILTRGATVRDAEGRPVRMAGSHSDITERRRVSEELIEREAQYRSIYDATTDGLIITHLDGMIVETNPAACAMFGYDYDEFVRCESHVLIHPDYQASFQEYLVAVRSGGPVQTRSVNVRKDGSLLDVEVRGTLIMYRGEQHILSIVHDVTERVRAFQLLEERVEERTRELSTLLDISHSMTSTFELKPLLRVILSQLKKVVNYTGATIFTLHENELTILDYQGPIPPDEVLQLRFPLARASVNYRVIHEGAPLIIADVRGRTPEATAFQQ